MPRRSSAKPFDLPEIFRHSQAAHSPGRLSRRHAGCYPALTHALNRARNAVGTALLRNHIERPLDCSRCAKHAPGRMAAIHADLTKPLEITWVCVSCARYAWQEREDDAAKAMAVGGCYVRGVWVAPAGVRPPDSPAKTLAAYSRKRGARGGDAATRLAVEKVGRNPTVTSNDVVQRFIREDLERYLSGQPSRIGDVLAGKGAEVVVKG